MKDSQGRECIPYNDDTKSEALDKLSSFAADYGGNNMYAPLVYAQDQMNSGKKKRIFLLTDGYEHTADQVIQRTQQYAETIRTFSFGVSNDADAWFVRTAADAGRGTATMVQDDDPNMSGKVVKALATSMEPSLRDVQYGFNESLCTPKELYRNTLVRSQKIIMESEFENIKFSLKAKPSGDGVAQEQIDLTFTKNDFVEVEANQADHIIKMAINELI